MSQRTTQAADAPDGSLESRPKSRVRRAVRVLVTFGLGLLLLVGLVLVLVVVVLPHLARRGDLNSHVEDILRQTFNLEIQVASVETDPLSRLAITHIGGLEADSAGSSKLQFSCERISVLYSVLDLLAGKVEQLALVRPRIVADLDEEFAGLISNWPPDAEMIGDVATATPPQEDGAAVAIGRFSLEDGDFRFRYVGQDFHLAELNVLLTGLGTREALTFDLEGQLSEAMLEVGGEILPRSGDDGPKLYDIQDAVVRLEGFDLAPLVGLVERMLPGFDVGGRVDLKGSVQGTWPQSVRIELSTDWQDTEGAVSVPGLAGARLGLRFEAVVLGELEKVDFDLALSLVSGNREATLNLAGSYEADESGGRVVFDDASRLESTGLGTVTLRGRILSLLEEPELDVALGLEDLDFQRTKETPVLGVFLDDLEKIHGHGELALEVRGSARDPVFRGRFRLPDGGVALSDDQTVAATVDGEVESVSNIFGAAGPIVEGATMRVDNLALEDLVRLAGWEAERFDLSGNLGFEVEVDHIQPPVIPEKWQVRVRVEDFAMSILAGTIATEDARIRGEFVTRPVERDGKLKLETGGRLRLFAPYLIVGDAAEDLSNEVVTLNVEVTMTRLENAENDAENEAELYDTVFIVQLLLPSLGPVDLTGTAVMEWSPRFDVRTLDFRVHARNIPNREFLSVYLGNAYEETLPFLAGSSFDGFSSGLLHVRKEKDAFEVNGHLTSDMDSVRLPAIDLVAEGLALDFPLKIGDLSLDGMEVPVAALPEGRLALDTVKVGGVEMAGIDLPFRLDATSSRLESSGTSLDFLGGRATVSRLSFDWSDGGQPFDIALEIYDADLQTLARAKEWPEGVGRLDADIKSLTVSDDSFKVDGEVGIEGFGGRIRLTDLVMENYSQPYFTIWLGSGEVRDLDLRELGAALDFGLMSGILDGSIEDFEFSGDEILRFRLDLETDPRPDVEQFINKNAIRSLRGLLAPFSAFEDLLLSKFYYEGFGFSAELEDGRFRMRGKYMIDGLEYLLYSKWWHLPQINIINGNPNQDYDWERVQAHVQGFFDSPEDDTPADEEAE